jgi:hypothetical protein
MGAIDKIFQELSKQETLAGKGLPVNKLPKIKSHKLGISEAGLPVFFILCDDANEPRPLNSDLELIRVEFSRTCELITENGKKINGIYTIISLKSNSLDIQQYFLEIVYLMLLNLPAKLGMVVLKTEIAKLINLFSRLVEPPRKTTQGLWSELLVILKAKNTDYLVRSWHYDSFDKFDFNDGKDKIEVKSTLKSRRVHKFSIEQLNPNNNSQLLIASVMMIQSGTGVNIFNLEEKIEAKLKDKNLLFILKEKIALTLGSDFERAQDVYYDFQFSVDTISFFNVKDIPKISVAHIQPEITNVHFESDLTNLRPVKRSDLKAQLHKSAF